MHPRTPLLLIDLMAAHDAFAAADAPVRNEAYSAQKLNALRLELIELSKKADDKPLIDDCTIWLAQALTNVALYGVAGGAKKWIELAKCFAPFVRTDLAVAIGAAHLPDAN